MACLNYEPSKVVYKGRVYPRTDMLEMRDKLLFTNLYKTYN